LKIIEIISAEIYVLPEYD